MTIAPVVPLVAAASGVGIVFLAGHTVYAERHGIPPWVAWLRLAIRLASAIGAAYSAHQVAAVLVPPYLPSFGEADFGKN